MKIADLDQLFSQYLKWLIHKIVWAASYFLEMLWSQAYNISFWNVAMWKSCATQILYLSITFTLSSTIAYRSITGVTPSHHHTIRKSMVDLLHIPHCTSKLLRLSSESCMQKTKLSCDYCVTYDGRIAKFPSKQVFLISCRYNPTKSVWSNVNVREALLSLFFMGLL